MQDKKRPLQNSPLRKSHLNPDPIKQFNSWFKQAKQLDPELAGAMTLATASKQGKPAARIVLLKAFSAEGFVFYTNYQSPKARDLLENPSAELMFYWRLLGRQVRISGRVDKLSNNESKAYFNTRPKGSQIGAWASKQSAAVSSRKKLDDLFEHYTEFFGQMNLPMPDNWGGFCLKPYNIEFWQNREDRLHDRFLYSKGTEENFFQWSIKRLFP